MTKAAKRAYQKAWYEKNKAKKANGHVSEIRNGELTNIINAYYTLKSSTSDGQIKADLTKVLTAIISKSQN